MYVLINRLQLCRLNFSHAMIDASYMLPSKALYVHKTALHVDYNIVAGHEHCAAIDVLTLSTTKFPESTGWSYEFVYSLAGSTQKQDCIGYKSKGNNCPHDMAVRVECGTYGYQLPHILTM